MENKLNKLKTRLTTANYNNFLDITNLLVDEITDESFEDIITSMKVILDDAIITIDDKKKKERDERDNTYMDNIREYNDKILLQSDSKKNNTRSRTHILAEILIKEEELQSYQRKLELNKLAPNNTIKLKIEKEKDYNIYMSEITIIHEELDKLRDKELFFYREIECCETEIDKLTKELKEYHLSLKNDRPSLNRIKSNKSE